MVGEHYYRSTSSYTEAAREPGEGGGEGKNFNILGGGKGERKRGKFYREGGKEKEKKRRWEGGGL